MPGTDWEKGRVTYFSGPEKNVRNALVRGELAVIARPCDPVRSDVAGAAYLLHRRSGLGLGAFEDVVAACLAGGIAERLISPNFAKMTAAERREEGNKLLEAWRQHGLYESRKIDDRWNPIWCATLTAYRIAANASECNYVN